ncbi:hypothetical protein RchiOBHm_Chr3g0465631 [Rosa chinensis]|uniref:Uncharacterized protein n=1 Tax=Rosa chinensis TaxID=74649 RepID=A0A2P6R9S0_ROSCH|nr:hypothetical protein RchiOBHm_Chr3g0465631 [Rosa chinensis]
MLGSSSSSGADKYPDSKDSWCFNFYAYKATFRQSIYSAFGLLLLNNQPSSDQFSRPVWVNFQEPYVSVVLLL